MLCAMLLALCLMLKNKNILLGVCGSIAAYKSAALNPFIC